MASPVYRGPWLIIRQLVLTRDHHQCQLRLPGCKQHATQVDHIVGLNQGGQPWNPTNLQAACKPCNVAKGNQDNPRTDKRRRRTPSRQW